MAVDDAEGMIGDDGQRALRRHPAAGGSRLKRKIELQRRDWRPARNKLRRAAAAAGYLLVHASYEGLAGHLLDRPDEALGQRPDLVRGIG